MVTAAIRLRSVAPSRHGALRARWIDLARGLLRFGSTYTLSQLVGTGAQLLVPVIVLSLLGRDSVGYVRAASAIAVGYLSVLLVAMARDYFPRAVSTEQNEAALSLLVSDQARLLLASCAPLILVTSALAPLMISILFSEEFSPAVSILQWMLVGDVFKLLSWTISFVILARGGPATYFLIELIGGTCLVVFTILGVGVLGVDGVGVAYLATYAIYLGVVWIAARSIVRLSVTSDMLAGIGLAVGLAIFQFARPSIPPVAATTALLVGAAIAFAIAWRVIRPTRSVKSRRVA
jgi:antigen flippase